MESLMDEWRPVLPTDSAAALGRPEGSNREYVVATGEKHNPYAMATDLDSALKLAAEYGQSTFFSVDTKADAVVGHFNYVQEDGQWLRGRHSPDALVLQEALYQGDFLEYMGADPGQNNVYREFGESYAEYLEAAASGRDIDVAEANLQSWSRKHHVVLPFMIEVNAIQEAQLESERNAGVQRQKPAEPLELIDPEQFRLDAEAVRKRQRLGDELGDAASNAEVDIKESVAHGRDVVEQGQGPVAEKDAEHEVERRAELIDQIHREYREVGDRFFYKDQPEKVAFRDKGVTLATAHNDQRVAFAMATMAEAKGWKSIDVKGHPEFRREVWVEGSMRGLKVNGYKPTEQDVKELEARREKTMRNTIEESKEREPNKASRSAGDGAEKSGASQPAAREYTGKLVSFGPAPYQDKPDGRANYYVQLEHPGGKQEKIWGVDLARAMMDTKAKPGDEVNVRFEGMKPVMVKELVRDKQGAAVLDAQGNKQFSEVEAKRNTWTVETVQREKAVAAVGAAYVASNVAPEHRAEVQAALDAKVIQLANAGQLPKVATFDKNAARQVDKGQDRPAVERNAERTR